MRFIHKLPNLMKKIIVALSAICVVQVMLIVSCVLARTWTDSTGKYPVQADFVKFENGQAAYAALRELAREIEELIQREPSKRSLLQALGELGAVIERSRRPALECQKLMRRWPLSVLCQAAPRPRPRSQRHRRNSAPTRRYQRRAARPSAEV